VGRLDPFVAPDFQPGRAASLSELLRTRDRVPIDSSESRDRAKERRRINARRVALVISELSTTIDFRSLALHPAGFKLSVYDPAIHRSPLYSYRRQNFTPRCMQRRFERVMDFMALISRCKVARRPTVYVASTIAAVEKPSRLSYNTANTRSPLSLRR